MFIAATGALKGQERPDFAYLYHFFYAFNDIS